MKTVNLADWEDILTEFERLAGGGYLFRGYADARWELKTSLERQTPGDMKASDAEVRLLSRRGPAWWGGHRRWLR